MAFLQYFRFTFAILELRISLVATMQETGSSPCSQQNLLRDRYLLHYADVHARADESAKSKRCAPTFDRRAQLADLLGVSRSQVTRWLRGAGIDPLNAEKVDLLELVWSSVLRLYDRDAARAWLFGINPRLGDKRPIDLVRAGRAEELMRAIRAERSDSFA